MTVSIAWVRTIGSCTELLFASDSRLSGDGREFDYCPKILALPRSDCAISFAGYTGNAYPLIHQLSLAISASIPLKDRVMDIKALRTHAIKIFDSMADSIQTNDNEQKYPTDVTFLFGGYSWVEKKFLIWKIEYSRKAKGFVARPAIHLLFNATAKKFFLGTLEIAERSSSQDWGLISFAGDQGKNAEKCLIKLLNSRLTSASYDARKKIDWEPFEVIRDMLRNPAKSHTIDGAPQLVKIYEHLNTQPIAVAWPSRSSGAVFLQGRPVLEYENIDSWILDPDTLETFHPKYSQSQLVPAPTDQAIDKLAETMSCRQRWLHRLRKLFGS